MAIENIFYVDYKPHTGNLMSFRGYTFPLEAGGSAKNVLQDIDILKSDFKVGLILFDYDAEKMTSKGVECLPLTRMKLIKFLLANSKKKETLFIVKGTIALGVIIKFFSPTSKVIMCLESPFRKLAWLRANRTLFIAVAYFILSFLSAIFVNKITADRKDNWVLRTKISLIKNKTIFLPNAVDTSSFFPKFKEKTTKTKELLYIGRISHWQQKNPELLLKSFELLAEELDDIKLTIFGDSHDAANDLFERIIKNKSLMSKITFIKGVAADDLIPYYRNSDLTLLTSFYEGTPYVILESLACGTPVIVTNVLEDGIITNGKNGYICNSFNEKDYTELIKKGLNLSEKIKPLGESLLNPIYDLKNRKKNLYDLIKNL